MLQEYSHSHGLGWSQWNKQDFPSKTCRWQQTTPKPIDATLQGCSCSLCLKAWAPPTFTVSALFLILFSRWRNPKFACYIEKSSVYAVYPQITEFICSSGITTLIITTFPAFSCPWTNFFVFLSKMLNNKGLGAKHAAIQTKSSTGKVLCITPWLCQDLHCMNSTKRVWGIKWFSVLCTEIFPTSLNLLMMLCRAKKSPNCW